MTKRVSFILLSAIFFAVSAWAIGDDNPVRWRSFVKTAPDGTGSVTLKALIAPGWHLYDLDIPEGGPKATSFDFSDSKGVEFTGKIKPARSPLSVNDPLFGMTLSWWDANIKFTVPFKITDKSSATIDCKISFMSCDGNSCRPPKTERISIPVKTDK